MQATRQAFGEALLELGSDHPEVVVLDADLSKSTKSDLFAKAYPDRFFEMGIAEANMIGVAAGLSYIGKIPFACSFACFLTGRYDIIRMSIAYTRANVRLIGTHAGLGVGEDGHSQMGLEDISLMRSLPTMSVFQPLDSRQTKGLIKYLVKQHQGPAYVRLTRQALEELTPPSWSFDPYNFLVLSRILGSNKPHICFVVSGATAQDALLASEAFKDKYATSVIHVHCLKPFAEKEFIRWIRDTDVHYLVSVEDHSVIGGLGSILADMISSYEVRPRLLKLGVQDIFGESGDSKILYERFGISANRIVEQVNLFLKA